MSLASDASRQGGHPTFEVNYSFWVCFWLILAIQAAFTIISSILHCAKAFFQTFPLQVYTWWYHFDFLFYLLALFWLPFSLLTLSVCMMLVRFRQKIIIGPEGIEVKKSGQSHLYPWGEVTEVRRGREQSKVPFWLKGFSHRYQIQLTLENKTGVRPTKILLIDVLSIKNSSQLIETLKQYASVTPALQSFFESEKPRK